MTIDTFQFLSELDELQGVPASSVEWMCKQGKVISLPVGEFLFQKGDASDFMNVILEGKFEVYRITDRGRKFLVDFEPGTITSQLPYSRMKSVEAFAEATEDASVFQLHKENFRTMIAEHFELTRALVHVMTSRVRNFTQLQVQNEKLMALGKLSAGLAHELNNPASAMVRSAGELAKHLRRTPESFKSLLKIQLEDHQVDGVQEMLVSKLDSPAPRLSMMQRSGLEEDIADWLEAHGEENGFDLADNFVEFGYSPQDLEHIYQLTGSEHLNPTLQWLNVQLQTVRMVSEIEAASKRIGDLVTSVKRYSYMDRDGARQPVDLNEGLQSTMTMLAHKARKNKVKVEEQLQDNLPQVRGLPGEINQVWTNLIDNALDAMEENGGTLILSSEANSHFAKIKITDSGPGISSDVQQHIFEPFYTTKPQGKGTGLGLDIVRKIIDQHHAEIRVESQPGNTSFTVSFPLE